jgi:RND family efflux transporter MFP subunit
MVEIPQNKSHIARIAGGVFLLAAVVFVWRHYSGESDRVETMRSAQAKIAEAGPRVEMIEAAAGPKSRTIKLLGDVRSAATVTLYAKISAYLKTINVDKGDKVTVGQLLAELDSPELEQQFAAASADLVQKKRNLERLRGLFERGSTTQVAMLQAETDFMVAENNVAGLAATRAYQTIRSPLEGRITARFVDPGALVTNAQTNAVSAQPLLTISENTRVRIYAYLQQQDVPFIKVGHKAEVVDASRPERRKTGEITRMTGELDPKSRTMLIEVHLNNPDEFFVPGSFVNLTLDVPLASSVQVPAPALLVRAGKTVVPVFDKEKSTVSLRPVRVGGTDGARVTVAEGLNAGEPILLNLPDEVTDGGRVQAVAPHR